MPELTEWNSFYVIVGSSAGALIGLQFVVMTLIVNLAARAPEAGAAFATPSVVHFGVVLMLSATASAPWHSATPVATIWGLVGLIGIVYVAIVTRRMSAQDVYRPVLEDWLFHSVLPFTAYVMLAASAVIGMSRVRPALFVISAATLVLLFVGIHNAWDAVTYHIFSVGAKEPKSEGSSETSDNVSQPKSKV
jgi:hypothetical protein